MGPKCLASRGLWYLASAALTLLWDNGGTIAKQTVHGQGGGFLHGRQAVCVVLQGDLDGFIPQPLRPPLDVDARQEQEGRAAVAHIIGTHPFTRQARTLQGRSE